MIRWMRHSSALCRAVWCSITVALFTAAIAVGTTWATFPGRNGDIVFSRSGRIYVMKPNGSEKRQLTFGPAADTFPAYSSSGKRIVFWRKFQGGRAHLYVMHADGSDLRRIPNTGRHDCCPAFSPNANRIVFQSDLHSYDQQIWVMRVDGTDRHRLTHASRWSGAPVFSPDGRRIAFERTDGVYVMRRDGRHLRRVAKADTFDGPGFSPSGRKLAFERKGEIYTVRVDAPTNVGSPTTTLWMPGPSSPPA